MGIASLPARERRGSGAWRVEAHQGHGVGADRLLVRYIWLVARKCSNQAPVVVYAADAA